MKKTFIALVALQLMAMGSSAFAQERTETKTPSILPSQPTPEMWFYEQELNRRNNPEEAVRSKAEYQAAQRQRRIAAMKWYGMSNSRPTVNPTPFGAMYSPTWASNSFRPFAWRGNTTVVVPVSDEAYRR